MSMRLERLKISAFKDEEFKHQDGNDFIVWMNPQSYQRNLSVKTTPAKEVNATGSSPTYARIGEETLSFKLVFDTTGLVLSPLGSQEMPADGVSALIEPLVDKIARVPTNGDRPNFVQLSWAQLQFRCLLTSLSVDYKLFRPDGTAIRAEASLSFTSFTSSVTLSRAAAVESKEITKVVTLLQGDTLPALCQRIYGDSIYYLDVARFNNIFSFRNMKVGTQIAFPPLAEL
jgi:hypothetical protein